MFSPKSVSHIEQYSLVKRLAAVVLSFSLVRAVYTYTVALANFLNHKIVPRVPYAERFLVFFDAKFDLLVLGNVDKAVAKAEEQQKKATALASTYRKRGEKTVEGYLKPVNEYALQTVNQYLPKAGGASAKGDTEISKLIDIVNDTFSRLKHLVQSKSQELSQSVVKTYNQEFDAVKEKNYYVKVALALVTTGFKLLKLVNKEYIEPLKATTTSYVSEKSSSLAGPKPALNGSAAVPVSASA